MSRLNLFTTRSIYVACKMLMVLEAWLRLTQIPRIQPSSPKSDILKCWERLPLNVAIRCAELAVIRKSSVEEHRIIVPSLLCE